MQNSLEEIGDVLPGALGPLPGHGVVGEGARHDVRDAGGVEPHAAAVVVVQHAQHVADLVGDGEGRGEAVVLDDGAGRVGLAHAADLRVAEGVARVVAPADRFSA